MLIELKVNDVREAVTIFLSLLQRFHKLSEKELEVTVELILTYFEYLEVYKSEAAAFKLYTETESRLELSKKLGVTDQVFRNYLTVLKKKNVLQEGMRINKVLIPALEEGKFKVHINISYAQE